MRWECDPWEPYHYPIYSTRYISEVDAEVKQTEDRLRWPGYGEEEGGGCKGEAGEGRLEVSWQSLSSWEHSGREHM